MGSCVIVKTQAKSNVIPSYVGMIIYSSTLSTLAKVQAQYGSNTTWTQLEGVFLLGADATYTAGSTGGEAEHTLTTAEMPSHNHSLACRWSGTTGSSGTLGQMDGGGYSSSGIGTNSTGGGQAHNNMPPYKAVYIWERTA